MVVEAERPCASATLMGSEMLPMLEVVTELVKLKVLLPLSVKTCVWLPPMRRRSPVTLTPVLEGEAPGVTVTVRTVFWPAVMEAGFAEPVAPSKATEPEDELRGFGGLAMVKSAELLLVFVPGTVRRID